MAIQSSASPIVSLNRDLSSINRLSSVRGVEHAILPNEKCYLERAFD